MRDEDLWFERLVEPELPHIADHADNAPSPRLARDDGEFVRQHSTDRVACRKISIRQRLVHDRDGRRFPPVSLGERPPGDEWNAERREVAVADDMDLRVRPLGVRRRY